MDPWGGSFKWSAALRRRRNSFRIVSPCSPPLLSERGRTTCITTTQIFSWVGTVTTTITGSPMLLFTVGFLAVGGAIGKIYADIKSGKNGKNLVQTIPC